MTTTDTQERQYRTRDVTGDLADSARRHLAYEALRRQAEISEGAARLALAAIKRRRSGTEEKCDDRDSQD